MTSRDREAREERLRLVAHLTRIGYSANQIAERAGCTRRQVTRDRSHLGISRPRSTVLTDEQVDRARALLDDGCSRAEVARTLGVNERTIRRRFPDRAWTAEQIADYTATLRKGETRR